MRSTLIINQAPTRATIHDFGRGNLLRWLAQWQFETDSIVIDESRAFLLQYAALPTLIAPIRLISVNSLAKGCQNRIVCCQSRFALHHGRERVVSGVICVLSTWVSCRHTAWALLWIHVRTFLHKLLLLIGDYYVFIVRNDAYRRLLLLLLARHNFMFLRFTR